MHFDMSERKNIGMSLAICLSGMQFVMWLFLHNYVGATINYLMIMTISNQVSKCLSAEKYLKYISTIRIYRFVQEVTDERVQWC